MRLRALLLGAACTLAAVGAHAQVPGYPAFFPPLTSGNCVQANSPFQATTTAAPCGVGTVSAGLINQLGWYAASGNTLSGLATANSGVLVTSAGGVPSISSTLPSGLAATSMALTTPSLGVATATSVAIGGATIGANGLAVAGHLLLEGVTSTGATGTANLVFSASPTVSGTVTMPDSSTWDATGANLGTELWVGDTTRTAPNVATLNAVFSTNAAAGNNAVFRKSNAGANSPGIGLMKSRGTNSSPVVITTGDSLGAITAYGYDGANYIAGGSIAFASTGTIGTNQIPGTLTLNTANASGANTQGLQINASQLVIMGTGTDHVTAQGGASGGTLSSDAGTLTVSSGGGTTTAFTDTAPTMANLASSAAALDAVCWNATGGVLTHNGAGALCSASLEELKDKIADIRPAEALHEIALLKPFWGKFKDDVTTTSDHRIQPMLGAHAVESIDARLAEYTSDGELHGVRYTNLSALLVAAVQELKADNDTMRRRIGALEHRK